MADAAYSNEIWKDIPGWEGWYQASSLGRVRSLDRTIQAPNRWGPCLRRRRGQILKQGTTKHFGHMTVGLLREGSGQPEMVHRLVCAAFHGPCPPDKAHAAHINGEPADNRPENLYWATVKENSEDSRRHGTMRLGVRSNLSKLSEDQVRNVRRRHADGETGYRIAKDLGVTSGCIYRIIHRVSWAHLE